MRLESWAYARMILCIKMIFFPLPMNVKSSLTHNNEGKKVQTQSISVEQQRDIYYELFNFFHLPVDSNSTKRIRFEKIKFIDTFIHIAHSLRFHSILSAMLSSMDLKLDCGLVFFFFLVLSFRKKIIVPHLI